MELFTTIIILKYEIGDTRDNSTLLLRLIDARIPMCMCEASDLRNINLNFWKIATRICINVVAKISYYC